DRASGCGGSMTPVAAFTRRNGEHAIVHRCADCGFERYNRIAVPETPTPGINANNILLCGLGATTDGALQQGAPNVF
ncbi:MAG: RNHCP domain-containing protein, partial [Chloroflexi bacterium]|nr:RNHCP domain-containing protein [Chloroflexota bacterium]